MEEETGTSRRRTLRPSAAARRGPLTVIAGAALVWLIHAGLARRGVHVGSYTSGLLTLAAMLAASCYAARRRVLILSLYLIRPFAIVPPLRPFKTLAVRLDQMRSWRVAHLLIGTLLVLPLWWHVEAGRGGPLEVGVLVLIILILASGLLGVVLQYAMPHALLQILERQVRVRDVDEKRRAIFVQAEERILGGSEPLVQAYLEAVRPILQTETSRWRLLEATLRGQDPGALVRGRRLRLAEELVEKDAATFRELLDLAEHKVRLDLNLFHLDLSTGWLVFHAAAVVCGAALVTIHIFSVLYFGGA
jgi:hypothetical protein